MSSVPAGPPDPSPRDRPLARGLGRRQAIVLYVSSVLGTGILVLPGITAGIAGPASLVAWTLLAVASLPFALTFASLSSRHAESGGIYAFAKEAFGRRVSTAAAALFLLWEGTGAPAVALIGGAYLSYALPISRWEGYVLGFAIVLATAAINYLGIRVSQRVQLGLIALIVGLLGAAVAFAAPHVQASAFTPFAPEGLLPIGTAAALTFWCFLGYENTSNVAEEFDDAARDLRPSVLASVAIIGVLYFLVAFVTVGTRAYTAGGGVAPFAAILRLALGPYAAAITAALAVVIVFGVVNAYTAGMARVAFAAARDGAYPATFAHVHPRTQVPDHALLLNVAVASLGFALFYVLGLTLADGLLLASGAAILTYVIGTAAGYRLFSGAGDEARPKARLALVALVISLAVLPLVGGYLVAALAVAAGACLLASLRPGRGPTERAA